MSSASACRKIVIILAWITIALPEAGASGKDSTLNFHAGKIALGTSASTLGLGADLAYQLNRRFSLRAGVENLSFDYPFNFEENNIAYAADLNYQSGAIFLMADFYLAKSLYLSAGGAYNLFHPDIAGSASRDWQYGDISIPAGAIGDFSFSVMPSVKISPYLGIGFGRNISLKRRIAVTFEIGAYYQGPPEVEISSSGLLAPTSDDTHQQKELLEKQFRQYYLYPSVKFGLSYVLFNL